MSYSTSPISYLTSIQGSPLTLSFDNSNNLIYERNSLNNVYCVDLSQTNYLRNANNYIYSGKYVNVGNSISSTSVLLLSTGPNNTESFVTYVGNFIAPTNATCKFDPFRYFLGSFYNKLDKKLYSVQRNFTDNSGSFDGIYTWDISGDVSVINSGNTISTTKWNTVDGPINDKLIRPDPTVTPYRNQCSGFITGDNFGNIFITTNSGIYKWTSSSNYELWYSSLNFGNIVCNGSQVFVADHTPGSNSIKVFYSTDGPRPPLSFEINPSYLASYSVSTEVGNNPFWSFAMTFDRFNNFYLIDNTGKIIYQYKYVICFKEDTQILTKSGYKLIQSLRKGDLVKTSQNGYKPIYQIGYTEINHPCSEERIKNQLYKCSSENYPELFEDLVITGCHNILVDNFKDEKEREEARKINNINDEDDFLTENKDRLPACVDKRTTVYEVAGKYTIYHFALENEDYYMNYGVYANGLLVETTSKRFIDETLIPLTD
jgi:hypothetical protein